MISYNLIIVCCAFVSSLVTIQAQRCNGGAECIQLQSCTQFYSQLQQGTTPYLTNVLRQLHCGFNGPTPLICCPPDFKQLPEVTDVNSRVSNEANLRLLPNYTICGIAEAKDKIVGGTRTDIDEHVWTALLRYDKPNRTWGFYCGGVLISSRYVLTAGHCVKGQGLPKSWKLTRVRLGEWNTKTPTDCVEGYCSDPPLDVTVEEIITHEGYDPLDEHQHNDIALLRLAEDVKFSGFVRPICLPTSPELRNSKFEGYVMEVAGWGKTESRSESDIKLKVSVPVVNNTQCGKVFARVNRGIDSTQICAGGEEGKDSCRGDSGGSLMAQAPSQNWVAVGVVSYGPTPCGTQGWPGVYTRVGAYIDWILTKIRA